MKTKKIKKIALLLIIWMSLPCLAQDKFTIHFKDGSDRTFHLDNIVSIYTSKYDSKNIFHSDESYQYVETLQGSFIYDISSIENIRKRKTIFFIFICLGILGTVSLFTLVKMIGELGILNANHFNAYAEDGKFEGANHVPIVPSFFCIMIYYYIY